MERLGSRRFRNDEKVEMAACKLLQTQQSEGDSKSCPVRKKTHQLAVELF